MKHASGLPHAGSATAAAPMNGRPVQPAEPARDSWLNPARRLWRRIIAGTGRDFAAEFNTPLKHRHGRWHTNERVVEIPFVLCQIAVEGAGKRALEFGCTRSALALHLASLGYRVTGIDLRPYPFTHPNLRFLQKDLLDLEDAEGFDLITAVSVLEHVGLGAYGEPPSGTALPAVITHLVSLLKPAARLVVTVPVGRPSCDGFLRSFSTTEIGELFADPKLTLEKRLFFCRRDESWGPVDDHLVATISNAVADRGPTGVNCVGCLSWRCTG